MISHRVSPAMGRRISPKSALQLFSIVNERLLRISLERFAESAGVTRWRGCIGCLIFTGHVPQKSHIINGSFAGKDLQLKVGYFSNERGFSVESSLQGILSNVLLWKRKNWSVVM